jgi:ABC-2 type transport system ATP-binding protein
MENFLEAKGIVKRFANHVALDGANIAVKPGRIFGLLGPNGAGKTTLIRIINRITMPDEGEVIFNGRPMQADDVFRIGYLPEERGLYKKMKVGEQAIFLARLKGLDKQTATRRLHEWFDKFGIMPWWNRKLEELSKGMQQKVQFVITVLHEPELLIFDEPFSGFDPVNAELLKKEILELKQKGHTIVFSTHNMNSVEEICDDIALINHSKVVLNGKVNEVRSRFSTGIYQLVTTGERRLQPSDDIELIDVHDTDGTTVYSIRKKTGIANSALISHIANEVEIRSFTEVLPSMNDIFLHVVGQKQIVEHTKPETL